jgi:hypothetical protein
MRVITPVRQMPSLPALWKDPARMFCWPNRGGRKLSFGQYDDAGIAELLRGCEFGEQSAAGEPLRPYGRQAAIAAIVDNLNRKSKERNG